MKVGKWSITGPTRISKQESAPVVKAVVGAELGAGFLDLSDKGLSSTTTVSDRLLKAYEGWVYANISAIAEEVSKIEFELYRTAYVKGELQFVEIESHPLLDLLDRFNPFTTTSQAMFVTEAHIELAGDTFYLLDNASNPKNIFILQPDKITVTPGSAASGYEILNYKYKYQNEKGKTEEIIYPAELVIQLKTPHPSNPIRGKSVVEAAAKVIDLDALTEEFLKNYFKNNAQPGIVLTSEQRITKDDITRITTDLRKSAGGIRNAFKTLILGGGLKPITIQNSLRDMLMLELENHMRDKLMALFKNTKASLGIVEDVNRANAEATLESWKQSVIKPKMQRITDTLNEFLVPRFGNNLILGFCDPVPENRTDDIEEVSKLMANTARQTMTVNEARAKLGLDPLPDAEFDTISTAPPQSLLPSQDNTPKALKNISLAKHLRRNGVFEEAIVQKNLYTVARKLAAKTLKPKKKAVKEAEPRLYRHLGNDEAKKYWEKQISLTDMVEKKFKDKLDIFLNHLEEKAITNLHSAVPKKAKIKAFTLFDEEQEIKAGIDLFTPLQQELATLSAQEAYLILHLDTIYNPSKTLKATIDESVKLFTQSFVGTDRQELTDILNNGIKDGMSVPQMEAAIREKFGQYRKMQSERIARTETLRASNAGALDAYKQSGVVNGKQWLTAGAVDECENYNGKIVWDLDGEFYAAEGDFQDGEPPLHPNCRCVLLPVVEQRDEATSLKAELAEVKQYVEKLEKIAGIE